MKLYVPLRLVKWAKILVLGVPMDAPEGIPGFLLAYEDEKQASDAWPNSEILTVEIKDSCEQSAARSDIPPK